MKTREILSTFGFNLRRRRDCFGQWFIAENQNFRRESKSVRDLVEWVVPQPPVIFTPGSIKSWAEECLAAVDIYSEVDPDKLARAAFAAYDLFPREEFVRLFAEACKVDRRSLMERRG